MSLLHDLIPAVGGGERKGASVHLFMDWVRCPYLWALRYLAPHPDGGRGLVDRTKASPLLAGGSFHMGLEIWYTSRCTNHSTGELTEDHGQPDLDRAIHAIETYSAEHAHEWESPEQRDVDTKLTLSWLHRYHDFYGPKGGMPEWPDMRVYVDDTGPWIERGVVVPLTDDFALTSRIDLVASDLGHPVVYEHKTTTASGFNSLQTRMHMAAQPTAELMALQHGSGLPFVPSACVINILNKNPGQTKAAKTQPFARPRVSRTEADIEKFRTDCIRWLYQIEASLEEWQQLVDQSGMDIFAAINHVFPRTGTLNDTCTAYNRTCSFFGLCQQTGREARGAGAFKARTGAWRYEAENNEREVNW